MRVFAGLVLSTVLMSNAVGVDVAHATRSIKLATCDYTGNAALASDPSSFIATHYDWMIIGGAAFPNVVSAQKAQNPNLKIFGYHDSAWTYLTNLPADMYFYDPDTTSHDRVAVLNQLALMLDPGSADRRNYALSSLAAFFTAGYDGAMLDDVWADPNGHVSISGGGGLQQILQYDSSGNTTTYATTPSWLNTTVWDPAFEDLLSYVHSNIDSSKLVIYNGIDRTPNYGGGIYLGDPNQSQHYSDGFMMEGFATSNAYTLANADPWVAFDSTWINMMTAMLNNSANTNAKLVVTVSYGAPDGTYPDFTAQGLRLYALASYLLGATDHSYFFYGVGGSSGCQNVSYFPEWDVNYGTPTNTVANDQNYNVYRRSFSNAEVFVNPSSTTASNPIPVSVPMYRVEPSGGYIPGIPDNLAGDNGQGTGQLQLVPYAPGSSFTVPPASAVILVYNPNL